VHTLLLDDCHLCFQVRLREVQHLPKVTQSECQVASVPYVLCFSLFLSSLSVSVSLLHTHHAHMHTLYIDTHMCTYNTHPGIRCIHALLCIDVHTCHVHTHMPPRMLLMETHACTHTYHAGAESRDREPDCTAPGSPLLVLGRTWSLLLTPCVLFPLPAWASEEITPQVL
jgi:hypothetical protein